MTVGSLIEKNTVIEAWIAGATMLLSPDDAPNYMSVTAGTQAEFTRERTRHLNEIADLVGAERPGGVSEVLFPACVHESNSSLGARLEAGWKYFGRGRRRGIKFSGWKHTYFERLTGHWMERDMVLHQIKEDRIRSIIQKANSWDKNVEAALYAHTDVSTDTLRPRGSPCLQYVQFRLFEENNIELFALYRAHDYFDKALGNMIGLQRLGEFVASETGRNLLRLTVFSLHPHMGGSKAALGDYVTRVTAL